MWMLALPALRSFFSLARAVRMSLARLSASIRWSSDRSGAAAEVLTGAGMWAASIAAGRGRARPSKPISLEIHLNLESRFRQPVLDGSATSTGFKRSGNLARNPLAGPRVTEVLGSDRDQRSARGEEFDRVGAAARSRPCQRSGCSRLPRRRAAGRPPPAAPRDPRAPRALPRFRARPVAGSIALAFSVLISETASAPPCFRSHRDVGGVGDIGRQLDDQRLVGQRSQRFEQRLGLASAAHRRSGRNGRWGRTR